MFTKGASFELEASVAAAAEILLELSRADLSEPLAPTLAAGLTWPSALKGRRSRRDAAVKERMMRLSPSSPFDLSGGSGASTSGSSSPEDLRRYTSSVGRISGLTSASSSKAEYNGRPPLSLRVQAPRSNGSQRPRKKMRLPEMREEVTSLEQENKLLQKEALKLQTACNVLSKENRSLEARLDTTEAGPSEDKNLYQTSQNQGAEDGFNLPDLNLPAPVDF
ncbi:hypothetical protein LUZ63_003368 [Rhynchospora breviuscula]|uniref:BZIP transcription factor n=1 Tax=Rhynchospora breviuscula TaxID=2022672 RepID=A0A9Q0HYN1_9POAL|nr:hypothetical protein LUZ63_003368 [Rhynchospora breviuscula]